LPALKVTSQVATPGAESAVYDSFVSSCIDALNRPEQIVINAATCSVAYFRFMNDIIHVFAHTHTHARTHARTHTHTHTHTFNGSFSRITRVSGYQKGKNQSGFY